MLLSPLRLYFNTLYLFYQRQRTRTGLDIVVADDEKGGADNSDAKNESTSNKKRRARKHSAKADQHQVQYFCHLLLGKLLIAINDSDFVLHKFN
jgi:hypothetical protein